ncbi:MAG: DUF1707 domain-containing protein [Longimicrobiales bacterium]
MSGSLPESPGLRELRERTIASLCDHFAQDRLTLDEFETRLDLAHKAVVPDEFRRLLADIHVPDAPALAPIPAYVPASDGGDDSRLVLSLMSGVTRRGNWRPGSKNYVFAVMGGVALDFRETPLPPGITDIFVFACMGGCEIIVPPALTVETHGFALMGGFDHMAENPPAAPGSPVLRVNGFALMGGVEIMVRLPGETARDAKRRIKEDRRLRRDWR